MEQQKTVWKFFRRAFIYSLPVLMLAIGLEVLQHILPNEYTHKKALLEERLDELEVLIMGSSHTFLGINPAYIQGSAFNMGATAQTLYYDRFLLGKYIDRMPQLKKVVLAVSYPSLGSESYKNPGDYNRSYHYAYFYGSDAFVDMLAPRRFSLVSLFTVKKSVNRSMAYYMEGDSLIEFDRNGWYNSDKEPARDLTQNGRDSGKLHDAVYDESLIAKNLEYLGDMIQLCKRRGVEVFLVSMPMWKSYIAQVNEGRYEKMVSAMDSLSSVEQLPYFNFTEDERFTGDDFFDSNHLNQVGAVKFTRIFNGLIYEKGSGAMAKAD